MDEKSLFAFRLALAARKMTAAKFARSLGVSHVSLIRVVKMGKVCSSRVYQAILDFSAATADEFGLKFKIPA